MLDAAAVSLRDLASDRYNAEFMSPWLFVAHSSWLENNRISRYKRLWKSAFGLRLLALAAIRWGGDVEMEAPDGVRFAAAGQIESAGLRAALAFAKARQAQTSLLWTRRDLNDPHEIAQLFNAAFPIDNKTGRRSSRIHWTAFIGAATDQKSSPVKITGGWEERQMWVEIFGKRSEVAELRQRLAQVASEFIF